MDVNEKLDLMGKLAEKQRKEKEAIVKKMDRLDSEINKLNARQNKEWQDLSNKLKGEGDA